MSKVKAMPWDRCPEKPVPPTLQQTQVTPGVGTSSQVPGKTELPAETLGGGCSTGLADLGDVETWVYPIRPETSGLWWVGNERRDAPWPYTNLGAQMC